MIWNWRRLALVILGLMAVLTWRYRVLRTEVNAIHFFGRAEEVLSLTGSAGMDPLAPAPLPEDLKRREGNLATLVQAVFPQVPAVDWLDPFAPGPDSSRILFLYYGYVRHASTALPVPVENKPVWFVWSPGPSGTAPRFIPAGPRDGWPAYEFRSAPYHSSNGLGSEGYLYVDAAGNRLGEIE